MLYRDCITGMCCTGIVQLACVVQGLYNCHVLYRGVQLACVVQRLHSDLSCVVGECHVQLSTVGEVVAWRPHLHHHPTAPLRHLPTLLHRPLIQHCLVSPCLPLS